MALKSAAQPEPHEMPGMFEVTVPPPMPAIVTATCAMPVPASVAESEPPAAAVTTSDPGFWNRRSAGLKCTTTAQVPCGGSAAVQVVDAIE